MSDSPILDYFQIQTMNGREDDESIVLFQILHSRISALRSERNTFMKTKDQELSVILENYR